MVDTFSPSINPTTSGTSPTDTDRVRIASFGDGYSQRAPDGLNYQERTVSLNWPSLNVTQFTEINGFFDANGAGIAFNYTLPLESTAMKWIRTSRSPGYVANSGADALRSLRVDLKRVFDL